jgi:hypothetical protein
VRLVNLTAHPVVLLAEDGAELQLPPSGMVARRPVQRVPLTTIVWAGHPVTISAVSLGEAVGLPAPARGVVFVVSRLVAEAVPKREDLVIPDQVVRNAAGHAVACRGFTRVGVGDARPAAQPRQPDPASPPRPIPLG